MVEHIPHKTETKVLEPQRVVHTPEKLNLLVTVLKVRGFGQVGE
jgi:hypothetical protein